MRRWLSGPKRNAIITLIIGVVFIASCVLWGLSVFGRLKEGGFIDDKSSSVKAANILQDSFPKEQTAAIVILANPNGQIADAAVGDSVNRHLQALIQTEGVVSIRTALTEHGPFVSTDGRSLYVAVAFDPKADAVKTLAALEDGQVALHDTLTAKFGGTVKVNDEISHQIQRDIAHAEEISFPILLILLIIIFRGLVAALLPLALGGIAILGAFLMVKGLTYVTDISVFAINIITLLGLGLAIDYSLFITSRFREELARGLDPAEAVNATMATAGRAVFFSGLTVAISMLSLLVFPQTFFRSMGLGGAAALVVAVTAALTLLPAILRLLGPQINALSFGRRTPRHTTEPEAGWWYRFGQFVMRFPLVTGGVALELLVIAGLPFLHIAFTNITTDALPASFESRQVDEALRHDFVGAAGPAVSVVLLGGTPAQLADYRQQLDEALTSHRIADNLPEIDSVVVAQTFETSSKTHLLNVNYLGPLLSDQALNLVKAVRAVPTPVGTTVESGGVAAALVDQLASQWSRLPLALALIALTTSILLFVMTGSFIIPFKAIILNVLSLSATFGILVWIFQDGHLTSWLGFTSTSAVDATMPVLVFAIAFGLAMDYEVFLLSRVKESYDRTGDTRESIAHGLQRTGGIITSAAVLLVVVIAAFSLSQISVIKQIGVGLALAVLLDATVVRTVLVPAAMRVLGGANWWAPPPLKRLVERFELD